MTWSGETVNKIVVTMVTTITIAGGGLVLSLWQSDAVQARDLEVQERKLKELEIARDLAVQDRDRLTRIETRQQNLKEDMEEAKRDLKEIIRMIKDSGNGS